MENKKHDKAKRPQHQSLSEFDESVPETHISLYALITNEKNTSIYMGKEKCQSMRKALFENVLTLFKRYGAPNYVEFFNYNAQDIIKCGLNVFTTHTELAPVAHLIECFSVITRRGTTDKHIISFGISKKLLKQYLRSRKEAKTKEEIEIPYLPNQVKPKPRDEVIFGKKEIKISEDYGIAVERNAICRRFEHWCQLQGVTARDGILMALESLFEEYPIVGLKEVKDYQVYTEFDKPLLKNPVVEKGAKEQLNISCSKSVSEFAKTIIERYNRDAENLLKDKLDISTYCNNALHLLNSNMPLKYRDPQLYMENLELERVKKQHEQAIQAQQQSAKEKNSKES